MIIIFLHYLQHLLLFILFTLNTDILCRMTIMIITVAGGIAYSIPCVTSYKAWANTVRVIG